MALADFNHIKDVLTALDTNKPSRFGYTEAAVTVTGAAEINALEGVYIPDDSTQINSIPDPDMVGIDSIIINTGLRSQAATIPRMAVNHFFGRLSLNLLKLTEKINILVKEHLVNRYITPSGNIVEHITVSPQADVVTLIQHQSALSASSPVTASAPITIPAAVDNTTAGVMTGTDKKNLEDLLSRNKTITGIKTFSSIPVLPASNPTANNEAVRKEYVDEVSPPIGSIVARLTGYFANSANGTFTDLALPLSPRWKLCDGSLLEDSESPIFNGSGRYLPNLTDSRFIMGNSSPGVAGGNSNNEVKLAAEHVRDHTHSISGNAASTNTDHQHYMNHKHALPDGTVIYYNGSGTHDALSTGANDTYFAADDPNLFSTGYASIGDYTGACASNAVHWHTISGTAGSGGVNTAFSILPKYLTAKYYMRIK